MSTSLSELLVLFKKEETSWIISSDEERYCPAFVDGNPYDLPCDCPKSRELLLGKESILCCAGGCPVRIVVNYLRLKIK
ncbi:MAG: hypothetical protein WCT07_00305 [Candidatus Paceibacterota bacterium]|jgi:hypothetical protein